MEFVVLTAMKTVPPTPYPTLTPMAQLDHARTVYTTPANALLAAHARARELSALGVFHPFGWSRSRVDPMSVLELFPALGMRPGFALIVNLIDNLCIACIMTA